MEHRSAPQSLPRPSASVIGFLGALLLGVLPISHWFVHGDSMSAMLAREAIWWCIALAILLWLTQIERLPLSSIGLRRPTWKNMAFGLLAAIAVTTVMALQFAVVIPLFHLSATAVIAQQQTILKTP